MGPRYVAWQREVDQIHHAFDTALAAMNRKDWDAAERAWEAYLAICPNDSVKFAKERIALVRHKRAYAPERAARQQQQQG